MKQRHEHMEKLPNINNNYIDTFGEKLPRVHLSMWEVIMIALIKTGIAIYKLKQSHI